MHTCPPSRSATFPITSTSFPIWRWESGLRISVTSPFPPHVIVAVSPWRADTVPSTRTVCVEREPELEGWKACRWAGRMRGVWRDILVIDVFLELRSAGKVVSESCLGMFEFVELNRRYFEASWIDAVRGTRGHVGLIKSLMARDLVFLRQRIKYFKFREIITSRLKFTFIVSSNLIHDCYKIKRFNFQKLLQYTIT